MLEEKNRSIQLLMSENESLAVKILHKYLIFIFPIILNKQNSQQNLSKTIESNYLKQIDDKNKSQQMIINIENEIKLKLV